MRQLVCGVALQCREHQDEGRAGVAVVDLPFQPQARMNGDMHSGSACCRTEQCPAGPSISCPV